MCDVNEYKYKAESLPLFLVSSLSFLWIENEKSNVRMKVSYQVSLVVGLVTGVWGQADNAWIQEQWDAIIVGSGPAGIVGMYWGFVFWEDVEVHLLTFMV